MEDLETPAQGTKQCPRCAEEIRAEAIGCRFCGADFDVHRRGYCSACHRPVDLVEGATTCPACGTPVTDVHVETRLASIRTAEPAPAADDQQAPPTPPQSRPNVGGVGDIRTTIVASRRQVIGSGLSTLACSALFVLPFLSLTVESLRIYEREPGMLGSTIFVEYAALGPLFVVFAVLILSASPKMARPRRIGGSRLRAMSSARQWAKDLKRDHGIIALFPQRGFTTRLVIQVMLWAATAATFRAMFSNDLGEPDVTARGGLTATWIVIAVGVLASLLMFSGRQARQVRIDEEGTLVG